MKKEKEPNYEEFLQLMVECYEAFKEVMKKGSPMEKALAMKGFHTLQQMIKEHVYEFSEKKGIDLKTMEKALCQSNKKFGNVCKETKDRLSELREEIEPLLKKAKDEVGKPDNKKRRKRTMEKRLRVKG